MVNGIIIAQDPNALISQIREMIEEQFNKRFPTENTHSQNEELTTEQVVELLKVTRQTVSKYVREGVLKKYKRGGRPIYIKKEVLESKKYIKKNTKNKKA